MSEEAPSYYEFRVLCQPEETKWIGAFISTIQYRGRIATMGNVTDVTNRRQAEDALRESEERFRMLSEAAEEGIAIHDKGLIVDANEALARMFGFEPSELIGMHAQSLATKDSWQIICTAYCKRI